MRYTKLAIVALAALLLSACGQPRFRVEGNVEGAEGKTLYFEQQGLGAVTMLDSQVLDAAGRFRFKAEVPSYPEFYRLRLEGKSIPLAVDSVVHLVIHSQADHFNTAYRVEGSEVCLQLQELLQLRQEVAARYDTVNAVFRQKEMSQEAYIEAIRAMVDDYKQSALPFIYGNPRSAAAYYALYQRLQRLLLFNPNDRGDNQAFAAVATSWQQFYPESPRTANLVRLALSGMSQIRKERQQSEATEHRPEVVELDKMPSFDITLPNIFGQVVSLSSLEGKVVMLDFTAYQTDYSAARTLTMRELYNRYETYGFEIFQVSLDTDEHFWKTSALNLPWVCVRDANSLRSVHAQQYYVQKLPTFFLIDRHGNIAARDETIKDLEKEIVRLLREK